MRTTVNPGSKGTPNPEVPSLWVNPDDPESVYILGQCDFNRYVAISLGDGNRWSGIHEKPDMAAVGLEPFRGSVTLEEGEWS